MIDFRAFLVGLVICAPVWAQSKPQHANTQQILQLVMDKCVAPLATNSSPILNGQPVERSEAHGVNYYATGFRNAMIGVTGDPNMCQIAAQGLGHSVDAGLSGSGWSFDQAVTPITDYDIREFSEGFVGFLSRHEEVVSISFIDGGDFKVWKVRADANHPSIDRFKGGS